MNIIEAVRSGKRFRREGFNWFPFNADHYNSVSKEDILAEDWEIEERKIEITEAEFDEAFRMMDCTEKESCFSQLKKRLFAARSGE